MVRQNFIADLMAGLTVSFAAISLGAAFGTMSGRGAFAGMIGAAVIPIIASAFGGTRRQASGPTGPMTAVSALLVASAYDKFPEKMMAEQFITLALIMMALMLIVAGFVKLGKLISLVPNVIILGFMNGIAVLIWKDQIVKVYGLKEGALMEGGPVVNTLIAVSTFLMIFGLMWLVRQIPLRPQLRSLISAVLLSILIMTVISHFIPIRLEMVQLGTESATLSGFLDTMRSYFPSEILQMQYISMAFPFALQLTVLAYLDSLLTALVIDRITRERSNLNKELVAQGLANGLAGVLQAIPGAQATIRSVLLLKEGAQTRLAGILIGVFALVSLLILKDYLTLVPAAVFAGVLLKAGLDVFEKDFPTHYFKRKWFNHKMRNLQFAFIAYATIVTVIIDLNVAVISGTLFFYLAKWKFGMKDVEPDFQDVPEQEQQFTTNSQTRNLYFMNVYQSLLEGNKQWVKERLKEDPDFFERLSKGQSPQVLWIGCSDSRVPANEITKTLPGEIFVHRNIANMVVHSDMNMLSVLDYSVNILKVKHVIVCGHYGCGGVKAAMDHKQYGLVDNWLRYIKDVYRLHNEELEGIDDEEERFNRFVELNVMEQVFDLSKTSIIQNAWKDRNEPLVHGWVYSLKTGIIKDLGVSMDSQADLPVIYRTSSSIVTGKQTLINNEEGI
jgi:carbonic anhydrase